MSQIDVSAILDLSACRQELERVVAERDTCVEASVDLCAKLEKRRNERDRAIQERDAAIQERDEARRFAASMSQDNQELADANRRVCDLLRQAHAAIWEACATENGLDSATGHALLQRIEKSLPDLKEPLGLVE